MKQKYISKRVIKITIRCAIVGGILGFIAGFLLMVFVSAKDSPYSFWTYLIRYGFQLLIHPVALIIGVSHAIIGIILGLLLPLLISISINLTKDYNKLNRRIAVVAAIFLAIGIAYLGYKGIGYFIMSHISFH